jgi:hypothetical protein
LCDCVRSQLLGTMGPLGCPPLPHSIVPLHALVVALAKHVIACCDTAAAHFRLRFSSSGGCGGARATATEMARVGLMSWFNDGRHGTGDPLSVPSLAWMRVLMGLLVDVADESALRSSALREAHTPVQLLSEHEPPASRLCQVRRARGGGRDAWVRRLSRCAHAPKPLPHTVLSSAWSPNPTRARTSHPGAASVGVPTPLSPPPLILHCREQNEDCCAELLFTYSYCVTCADATKAAAGARMAMAPGYSELAYDADEPAVAAPAPTAGMQVRKGYRGRSKSCLAVYTCAQCGLNHQRKSVGGSVAPVAVPRLDGCEAVCEGGGGRGALSHAVSRQMCACRRIRFLTPPPSLPLLARCGTRGR